MMNSSVIEKRATTNDLIKYGGCPIREFIVYIVDFNLILVDSFKMVIDITEKNFRDEADRIAKEYIGDREDYILKVQGRFTTALVHSERLDNSYKANLCKIMDYDTDNYMKQLDNNIVRICLKLEDFNDNSEDMVNPEYAFRNSIDYSGFGVV